LTAVCTISGKLLASQLNLGAGEQLQVQGDVGCLK